MIHRETWPASSDRTQGGDCGKSVSRFWLAGVLLLVSPALAQAAPDLRHAETINGVTVWPDHRIDTRYYHLPGEVELAVHADGKPHFSLLSTRYIGTAAGGDQGRREQYNRLSFTVVIKPPSVGKLDSLRQQLESRYNQPVELRPLPVLRMPTQLVYQPLDDPGSQPTQLPQPSLEQENERGEVWNERSYALRLTAAEAQLLHSILEQGGVRFSLAYGLVVNGIGNSVSWHEIRGSSELVDAVRTLLEDSSAASDEQEPRPLLASADTTGITIDLQRWPELVGRFDLNERVPPGFAAIDIRCYDFQRLGENNLFEVRVDVRAQTVSGSWLMESVVFSSLAPELVASRVRFPVAVRLDRPYAYRITRVGNDGREETVRDWTERDSWTELLDVTRPPQEADELSTTFLEDRP